MMDNPFDSFWKDLMKLRYPALDKKFHFQLQFGIGRYIVLIKNKFRQDLNKYFFKLKFWDELNQHSVILFNSHLKLEGKTIFYKERYTY